jgi:GLPGLI family protein
MKHSLYLFLLFSSYFGFSQSTEGLVKYKKTTYFEFENMPSDMPNSSDEFVKLSFTNTESLFEKDADVVIPEDPNAPRWARRMKDRNNKTIYKKYEQDLSIEQMNFFGKDFLISDSISSLKWKVSAGEQKTILGYLCMKALYKDSTENLVVFFTPQIPVSSGPDKFGKLPGLILEVQSAQVHIIATDIKLEKLSTPISQPTKGDKMTRANFNKLRDEKMKEQGEMWGKRDGNIRIRRN